MRWLALAAPRKEAPVDHTGRHSPMASKRLAMVPGDSSAARMPLPGAAMAFCNRGGAVGDGARHRASKVSTKWRHAASNRGRCAQINFIWCIQMISAVVDPPAPA